MIQQAQVMVVERLGKFHRILGSGIHIIWPIIETPRRIEWKYIKVMPDGRQIVIHKSINRIDLRETVYDFPRQSVITKDNVVIEINALLYFQITDPKKAVYEIVNLPDAIEKLTQTTLRNVIGELDLDETLVLVAPKAMKNPNVTFIYRQHGRLPQKVYVKLRPYLYEFLEDLKDDFELIIECFPGPHDTYLKRRFYTDLRTYIRINIIAQSQDSVPPAPGCMYRKQLLMSFSPASID